SSLDRRAEERREVRSVERRALERGDIRSLERRSEDKRDIRSVERRSVQRAEEGRIADMHSRRFSEMFLSAKSTLPSKAMESETADVGVLVNMHKALLAVLSGVADMTSKTTPMAEIIDNESKINYQKSMKTFCKNNHTQSNYLFQIPTRISGFDTLTYPGKSHSWSMSTVLGGAALLMAMRGSRLGSAKC
ncbi:hypothetical protein FOCC_FOCC004719, partial [Frankliniella occidentalis]